MKVVLRGLLVSLVFTDMWVTGFDPRLTSIFIWYQLWVNLIGLISIRIRLRVLRAFSGSCLGLSLRDQVLTVDTVVPWCRTVSDGRCLNSVFCKYMSLCYAIDIYACGGLHLALLLLLHQYLFISSSTTEHSLQCRCRTRIETGELKIWQNAIIKVQIGIWPTRINPYPIPDKNCDEYEDRSLEFNHLTIKVTRHARDGVVLC